MCFVIIKILDLIYRVDYDYTVCNNEKYFLLIDDLFLLRWYLLIYSHFMTCN